MPIISKFYGIIIRMYFKDNEQHKLPHLHANYNEYTAIFDFDGNMMDGEIPNNKRKIIQAWIEIHQEELNHLWKLLVKGKEGYRIDPLK